ncbi:hypothetical protein OO184_16330, partial [Photorhabdus sp. APURE]|uniref:hypothetical protein n=1 Tax=Photorhabdus aballayi TaxID=2991723 RepID=UPI00223CCE15
MAADRQRLSPRTPMFSAGRPAFTAGHAEGREAVCAQGRAQSAFHCTPRAHREPANIKIVRQHSAFNPASGCPAGRYRPVCRLTVFAVLPGASAHALSLSDRWP